MRVALGFQARTGWAALVALRRRVELGARKSR
jgi:hypothetical protein